MDRLSGVDQQDASETSPLVGAVASQVFPAGQGLLDEAKAEAEAVIAPGGDIVAELRDVLSEQAVASVELVARVVSSALNGEVPGSHPERKFASHEVRDLLPWLLANQSVTRDTNFWMYVAENVSLKHLEDTSDLLQDLDLTPLCNPGWKVWQALRAALGVAELGDSDPDPSVANWKMHGKNLVCEIGDAAFRFTTYGQSIPHERNAVSSATWEAVRTNLTEDARLRRVVLRGLVRSITVGAEESLDVAEDVNDVLATVSDQYYVDEIVMRYGASADDRTVRLALGEQIAYNSGAATVRDLMVSLAGPGAYRRPVDLSPLDETE